MKTPRLTSPRIATLVALATLTSLAAGCSKDSDEQAIHPAAPAGAAKNAARTAATKPAAGAAEDAEDRMANAVANGKTAAAVDLKYDISSKPAVGTPFEVELAFVPRLAADTLDVQLTGMEGLTIASAPTLHFDKVIAGQSYTAKVLVSAGQSGLYYIGVVAKMASQIQSDARTFSVPVVVGTPAPAAQKPAPEKDSTGRPVESMPAKEPPAS